MPALSPSTRPFSHRLGLGRKRRGRDPTPFENAGATPRNELRNWLAVIDAVLGAVEQAAWSARDVADSARQAWSDGGQDLREAKGEIFEWSEQATRLTQTGFMLARIAAAYRFHGLRSAFVSRRRAAALLDDLHVTSARHFYQASATHGGAFMKVGQLLSARADLLPAVWIRELEKLQDQAPSIPFAEVQEVIERDFGRPLAEIFASFERTPLAAASIGQVHRAVTSDGLEVAVKVQRPGIGARVKMDLELLEAFFESLQASLPQADYDTIIREIRSAVLGELDYVVEAETAQKLCDFFRDHPRIIVPPTVGALCTEHVLTTRFETGEKITSVLDALEIEARTGDVHAHRKISNILGSLLEAYLRQVLQACVFQADPHPGNLLVTTDAKLVVLDFGCSQVLTPEVRQRYLALMRAFIAADRGAMARLFAELGFSTKSGRPDTLHEFADALLSEIRQAGCGKVSWPTKDELVARATKLLSACNSDPVVAIPGEFVMIARVFATLGGMFARYEPDLDFAAHVMPVLGQVLFTDTGA